jgi:hypothetical protein
LRLGTYAYFESLVHEDTSGTGGNLVIPISGTIELGRELGAETNATVPLLRTGKVTLVGQSLLDSTQIFEASAADLHLGDGFEITAPETAAEGVIVLNEEPALAVSFRCKARGARVIRPGGGRDRLTVPLQTRLAKDPLVQHCWLAFLFLLGVVKVIKKPELEVK